MGVWNWVDWTFAIIIVLSVILAIRKGFIRELISLATLVAAIVISALEFHRTANWFADLTRSHEIALAAGFLTIFVIVLAAGAIVSLAARLVLRTAGVEWFDRFLGGVFGLIRGIVIDAIVLMILVAFAIKPNAVGRSRLAPYVSTGSRALALLMPGDLKADFRSGFQKFRQMVMQSSKRDGSSKNLSM